MAKGCCSKNRGTGHGHQSQGPGDRFPSSIGISAQKITYDFIIDGECIGDVFYAFDMLEWQGEDYRQIVSAAVVSLSEFSTGLT